MNRYTKKINDVFVVNSECINCNGDGYYGDTINKLAEFENIIDELLLKQSEISKELEALRSEQQTKSYKFRDLLGHKLINSSLITIFKSHNLM